MRRLRTLQGAEEIAMALRLRNREKILDICNRGFHYICLDAPSYTIGTISLRRPRLHLPLVRHWIVCGIALEPKPDARTKA